MLGLILYILYWYFYAVACLIGILLLMLPFLVIRDALIGSDKADLD